MNRLNILGKIKKSKLVQNALLNTIAAAIPIVVLQLLILPLLGRYLDSSEYGLVVTILALLNVVPATLGNSLNNIRLLHNNTYIETKDEGDFNCILLAELALDIVIVALLSNYYLSSSISNSLKLQQIILVIIVSIFWLLREYHIVAFLINLRYDCIFINNVLLSFGYCIGFLVFRWTNKWESIYITGYVFSLIYIFCTTGLWKEKLNITQHFKKTFSENIIYIISCFLYRVISYADKMLLYPVLGGTLVSIYYAATLSGKVVNMVVTPLSGVMLSHLSKKKEKDDRSFTEVFKYGLVVCIIGYFICVLISRPILKILYPQYVDEAMQYILVTTATVSVSALISLINPYILKFKTMKWQVVINLSTLIVYVAFGLALMKLNGLLGFCFGCLIANVFKLVIMIAIYSRFSIRRVQT